MSRGEGWTPGAEGWAAPKKIFFAYTKRQENFSVFFEEKFQNFLTFFEENSKSLRFFKENFDLFC